METKNIKQSVILPCTPKEVYEAWMDSQKHGEMVGGSAIIDPKVGGKFSIWDGDIFGTTTKLDSKKYHIVQLWRYEYPDWPKDYFSQVIIDFVPLKGNACKVVFKQTGIPVKYADDITQGWKDYYWQPMKEYFQK